MKKLILILGDQLSHDLNSLKAADKAVDIVLMAELRSETGYVCLLYTSPSPRDISGSRMPSSA